MKIRAIVAAALVVLAGVGLAITATLASAAVPNGVKPLPAGTKPYYTYNKGYNFVVATSGINVSETKSFEIDAPPYGTGAPGSGVLWEPYKTKHVGPISAFSNYINQVGEFVYGPGKAWIPQGYPHIAPPTTTKGLTLVWKGKNVYTNHVETYVYKGTGLHSEEAYTAKLLLTTGSPFPTP